MGKQAFIFILPPSTNSAKILHAFGVAADSDSFLSASEEAVDLVDQHLHRSISIFHVVGPRERVRCRQDVIGVHSGATVQPVPDHCRQVKEQTLSGTHQLQF